MKSSPISTLNFQNLSIFMTKCGKFFYFCGKIWQNLGFEMSIFNDARTILKKCYCKVDRYNPLFIFDILYLHLSILTLFCYLYRTVKKQWIRL